MMLELDWFREKMGNDNNVHIHILLYILTTYCPVHGI